MTDYGALVNSPIGENCTIDGINARCIFDIDGGEYEESVPTLRVPSSQLITSASVVIVRGKRYGVISIIDDTFGECKVILGDIL